MNLKKQTIVKLTFDSVMSEPNQCFSSHNSHIIIADLKLVLFIGVFFKEWKDYNYSLL